jgi:tetratricopeptide (TPR) repeat protein
MDRKAQEWSLEHVRHAISIGSTAQVIEDYKAYIREEPNRSRRALVFVNRALAYLSLELTKLAINDCDQALQQDPSLTLAYLVKGTAHLWACREEQAIRCWDDLLHIGGPILYFSVAQRLIQDPNYRTHIFSARFDVIAFLNEVSDYSRDAIFCDSELQQAFEELRNDQLVEARDHFDAILYVQPDNLQAYRGRGTAECLLNHWKSAIADLSRVITGRPESIESSKFRGIAHAALGNYSAAVADFSMVLSKSPLDYETLAERARIQMIRKFYSWALADFQKIPDDRYDDSTWCSIAECHYALGDLAQAKKVIENGGPKSNERALYTYFLILRDSGLFEEATAQILRAIEMSPSYFLLRNAADFMFDLGRIQDSIPFYRQAIDQRPQDADSHQFLAIALFHRDPIAGLNILKRLSDAAAVQEDSFDFCQELFDGFTIKSGLKNFTRNPAGQSPLRAAATQCRLLLHLIKSFDQPITAINWTRISGAPTRVDESEMPARFSFPSPDEQFIDMVRDADRLGRRCLIRAPEVIDNRRLIRGLGFCVLCITSLLREKLFQTREKEGWRTVLSLCSSILTLADLRMVVRPIVDDTGELVRPHIPPIFLIKQGDRSSPRFHAENHQFAENRLRTAVGDTPSSPHESQSSDLTFIYAMVQHDVSHFGKFKPEFADEVTCPSVNVRFLGARGCELFVRPPDDMDEIKHYYTAMDKTWELAMRNHLSDLSPILPGFVELIWLLHPLTKYSAECGHAIWHAYVLALKDLELEPIVDGESEIFMKQMVHPNMDSMKKIYRESIAKKSTKSNVKSESIDFWRELPTIARLFPLYELGFDK